jgi:hypothetical protein
MTDPHDVESLLAHALRSAPRRYRMPPLPADAHAPAAVRLAFAIDEARAGRDARELFTASLADLIRAALRPADGDASFQALVLRTQHAPVEEHVRLAAQAAADRRAVRASVDAVAHPGKLRGLAEGLEREALARWHGLASAGEWKELGPLLAGTPAEAALQRLLRAEALLGEDEVRAYVQLMQRHGPLAGSDAAAVRGRTAARVGDLAEQETVQVFGRIARRLNDVVGGDAYRVARSLLTPAGFPGAAQKTKDEWDVALVRGTDFVLIAEVKASPASATSDLARLLRGLRRLAHADPHSTYGFPSAEGEVRISGASLRALQPQEHALPPQVIYCCTASPEADAPLLSAAARAVLLGEAASLSFADAILRGESPPRQQLEPVWEALTTAPRLRSALHQYDSARIARDAMLHPEDLLQAFEAALNLECPGSPPSRG